MCVCVSVCVYLYSFSSERRCPTETQVLGAVGWIGRQAWARRREMAGFKHAYAYVIPASLSMAVLVGVPFVVGAGVSLFAHRGGTFTFVGLANFANIVFARIDWTAGSCIRCTNLFACIIFDLEQFDINVTHDRVPTLGIHK